MTFALTNIWLLRLQHTPASARMVAMFGGGALMAIVCAVLATVTGVIAPATAWPSEATGSLALAFIQISAWAPWVVGLSLAFLLSNFTLQYGAARLSAHTTSMVMMSEIVFASVSSVALGASALTWRISAGGGMIVLAALLASQVHTTKDKPS